MKPLRDAALHVIIIELQEAKHNTMIMEETATDYRREKLPSHEHTSKTHHRLSSVDGPFSLTCHSLLFPSNPLNALNRSNPSMAIARFFSTSLASSSVRFSRNSSWISLYKPSLFFDGNRFVALRMFLYSRSVDREEDDEADMLSFCFLLSLSLSRNLSLSLSLLLCADAVLLLLLDFFFSRSVEK